MLDRPEMRGRLRRKLEQWPDGKGSPVTINDGLELLDIIDCLEKEAEWLAAKLEYHNTPHECELCATIPGGFGEPCPKPLKEQDCAKCWREAARKAVRNAITIDKKETNE